MAALGVVLAGGAGTRMGGAKAVAELDGEPLVALVLRALAAVTPEQVVVAKAATALPPGTTRWVEPDALQHPLTGVRHALSHAGGRAVLCCAVDLPLLDAPTLQRLLDAPGAACVVPRVAGRLEPLCALWRPGALAVLDGLAPDVPMREAVAALDPVEVAYADPRPFTNVNTPGELAALSRR